MLTRARAPRRREEAAAALRETARAAFDGVDADRSGSLDASEIMALSESLGKVPSAGAARLPVARPIGMAH